MNETYSLIPWAKVEILAYTPEGTKSDGISERTSTKAGDESDLSSGLLSWIPDKIDPSSPFKLYKRCSKLKAILDIIIIEWLLLIYAH